MTNKLLNAIENHARISTGDLAAITGTTTENVEKELDRLEDEKIICGYHTIINWDKVGEETADAFIEVKVTPQKGVGFDQIAEQLTKYPQVNNVLLVSGNCDFIVFIQGRSMREIAMFVSEELAPIEGVLSTTTQFILKKYKQDGFMVQNAARDERFALS